MLSMYMCMCACMRVYITRRERTENRFHGFVSLPALATYFQTSRLRIAGAAG